MQFEPNEEQLMSLMLCSDDPMKVGAALFVRELKNARLKFGPANSAHEAYAVLLEEMDEVKSIVWQNQSERNYNELRKELIQVGAMTLAFLVEIAEKENRR